jgi:tetratricopeptide (TPR) repeat protein
MTYTLNIKKIRATTAIILGLIAAPALSQAQEHEEWTGTNVGTTFDWGNNSSLKDIRKDLNDVKIEEAVRKARKFVASVNNDRRSGQVSESTYGAYNALCISLTANGDYDEALDVCNTAIMQYPKRWQAINSRGSLNYRSGKYDEALRDYQDALSKAPSSSNIQRVLQHNVEISQAKIATNR